MALLKNLSHIVVERPAVVAANYRLNHSCISPASGKMYVRLIVERCHQVRVDHVVAVDGVGAGQLTTQTGDETIYFISLS
jgi:hypothetical protein